MAILKKKKKTKVAAEPVEEVKTEEVVEEVVDDEIQTTFNDDQEGILEDVILVENIAEVEALEKETEDC